jgi:hypothetical protein
MTIATINPTTGETVKTFTPATDAIAPATKPLTLDRTTPSWPVVYPRMADPRPTCHTDKYDQI